MFIEKLKFNVDLNQMIQDLDTVVDLQKWPPILLGTEWVANQISLRHRPNAENTWLDGIGSLKDDQGNVIAQEKDFTEWNKDLPVYTKNILEEFAKSENIKFGRIRYMRLASKTGLTIHRDFEYRYHIVLKTHPFALFGHAYENEFPSECAKCYHVPADGHVYKVDTRMGHFVYNGSKEDRVHLVISSINE